MSTVSMLKDIRFDCSETKTSTDRVSLSGAECLVDFETINFVYQTHTKTKLIDNTLFWSGLLLR